jgi:hypothetical protein
LSDRDLSGDDLREIVASRYAADYRLIDAAVASGRLPAGEA